MKKIRVLGKGNTALAIKEKFENAELFDDNDIDIFDKASDILTVVSPGIPPYNSLVQNTKNPISDYDLFYENMPLSIWISGTNGKTTTTQMMQTILEEKNSVCGGNIGYALSTLDEKKDIWILETSSFTLHYTKTAKPNIYILLPISEDHISWHGTYSEYKKAKLKPLQLMNENDIAIIPDEFKDIKTDAFVITYKSSDDLSEYFGIDKSKVLFNEPFLLDAILALCAKKILFDVVDYEKINTYKVDKHKVEEFKDKKNRLWIDDSKATNVDATINALVPYKSKNIHLILGGDDKGVSLEPLFNYLKDFDIQVYAIGANCNRVVNYCKEFNIDVDLCETLETAVLNIDKKLKENSLGVLSPAAASLDQFSSYKDRGEQFKKFVFSLS